MNDVIVMSLGVCIADTDNYQNIPVVEGLTLKFQGVVPSFDCNVVTYQVSCLLVSRLFMLLQEVEKERRKHRQ